MRVFYLIPCAFFCFSAAVNSPLLAEEQSVAETLILDLSKATQIALDQNLNLRSAKEQIQKAHGVTIERRSGLLPQVVGSAAASKVDQDSLPKFGGQSFSSDENWDAGVQVNQNVFAAGKYWNYFKQGRFEEKAAEFELAAVLQDTLFAVREKFYDVLLARAQVEVQKELLTLQQEELDSETKKRDAGTVSDFNVLRAEVAVANSRTPLIRAENNARLAIEELSRVLGLGAEDGSTQKIDVQGELGFEPYVTTQEAVVETAQKKRPELERLRLLVEAAKRGVRVAQAAYLPEISVHGGYAAQKDPASQDFSDDLHGWQVGAKASWNIFDSLGTAGRVSQAVSGANLATLALQRAVLDISVEARRAYSSFIEARELVSASKKTAEQARESLRLAKARFDVGAATQLDVLDTQVALQEARTNEVQALHDYALSVDRLKRAMGELT